MKINEVFLLLNQWLICNEIIYLQLTVLGHLSSSNKPFNIMSLGTQKFWKDTNSWITLVKWKKVIPSLPLSARYRPIPFVQPVTPGKDSSNHFTRVGDSQKLTV